MSISTYGELKTAIANWLARETLTAYIPDFIMLGENRIYRELRVREMETSLSTAISSGVIAVPSGYVELKFAYVDGTPVQRLTKKDPGWIYEYYPTRSSDGKPSFIAREADNFIFGPYPDSGYTIKGVYWKKLDALSDSNTSNWLTVKHPGLILFASLCEAEPFIKNDERIALWEAKYQEHKEQVIKQDKREAYSGSPLVMTASSR